MANSLRTKRQSTKPFDRLSRITRTRIIQRIVFPNRRSKKEKRLLFRTSYNLFLSTFSEINHSQISRENPELRISSRSCLAGKKVAGFSLL
ncbi:hypothetical protein L3X38_041105 [Prunus dulcis]|uniref:Uncharacterized protein n=1 Tax=Prunus dulcis TaxID=3755 RepID=A0AAD4YIK3_PRUDU|nr:hypothetical protein L3X38_041105 [Prunus dulcis]